MLANNNQGRVLLKLGIVLVVLAGIAVAAFSGLQKTARVKVAKVDTAVDAVTGTVEVDADGGTGKEFKAESDGKVIACDKLNRGATFKKGDVLLELDDTDLKRQIDEYKRNYANARRMGQMELTGGKLELLKNVTALSDEERAKLYREVNLTRTLAADKLRKLERMFALHSVSEEDVKTARHTLETVDNTLQIRAFNDRKAEDDYKVQIENFEIALKRMTIEAPSDGAITESLIWEGALIGRGHVVAKWMSHARIVTAKISEESFGRVRIGQKAKVRLLTYGDTTFDAEVSKMLPTADEAQRFTVYLDVKVEKQEILNPRSTGEVTITVDRRANAVLVPRLALFDGDKICVVKNGRVEKRTVEVGYVNLTEAEIVKGIAQGDHVIIETPQRFRDGDRVRSEVVP